MAYWAVQKNVLGAEVLPKLFFDGLTMYIISGFRIYGAAVVPDSGVGNTWQRLTLVLHEFLSNGLTPYATWMVSTR